MNFLRRIRSNSMVISPLVELVRGLHSSGKSTKKKTHAEGSALSSSVNNRRSVYFFSISLWFLEVLFLSYRMLCVPHLPLQHRQKKNPAPQYFSLSCILSTYKFIVVSTFIFKTACLLDKWFFRLGAMQTEKGQTHSTSERKAENDGS